MKNTRETAHKSQNTEQLNTQIIVLLEKMLQQQLNWFKHQLFGRKYEKLLENNLNQKVLFESLDSGEPEPEDK